MKDAQAPKSRALGGILWALTLAAVIAFLLVPATNRLFVGATKAAPYAMGFVKFAILATMGEILALRITQKRWTMPKGVLAKAAVWGVVGMMIVLMFQLYPAGVQGAAANGYLYLGEGWLGKFLAAFLGSAIMNLTFAPVFMAAHRISDLYIDERCAGRKSKIGQLVRSVEWPSFIRFIIARTIPLFWIPAHTISFLLPADYRVLFAAFLSIALGAILAYAKSRN